MLRRIWIFTKQTAGAFNRDHASQHAAAIAYFALFATIPLAILFVSILGFVFTDADRKQDLVNEILEVLPLSGTDGRDALQRAVDDVSSLRGPIAAVSLVATLWTASAMFGSIRRSLNVVWNVEEHRPFFRAKLVDLAQVGAFSGFLVASIAATGVMRWIREASADFAGPLAGSNALWEIPAIVIPAALTFITFSLLYRYVPAADARWRDALPGALLATILFEALKNAFAFYVANFSNYNVIYGSLAGVLLFLLNTFLASNILLVGGELTHVFHRYYDGELDAEIYPLVPGPTMTEQAVRAFKGLFIRQ